jgi:dsDNA-specific endonuclease/ATPase MutS2
MSWAIENNVKTLVFIHGVGEGVLRHEINERLRMYENISWRKASIKEYGDGATEVTILHD